MTGFYWIMHDRQSWAIVTVCDKMIVHARYTDYLGMPATETFASPEVALEAAGETTDRYGRMGYERYLDPVPLLPQFTPMSAKNMVALSQHLRDEKVIYPPEYKW